MNELDKSSMFYPIVGKVREALMKEEFLPADDGTFTLAKKAKIADGADLRDLLSPKQLGALHEVDWEQKWLSREITERRTPDLRKYLMKELEISEIDREGFARRISESFLAEQSDHWFVLYYRYLSGHEPLWRSPRSTGDTKGILLSKPILRLQDESHKIPFRSDGTPNAFLPPPEDTDFPIVTPEITKDEKALEFLKKLGLAEPDAVAEAIRIISKYTQDHPHISDDEHMRDMKKILHAYLTDSQKKKEQLANKLKKTAFIRAENLVLQQIEYKKPRELYIRNDDLLLYFYGNKDVWFISSEYDSSLQDRFKDLGVTDEIRIRCEPKNGSAEYVQLEYKNGYRRGLKGFDPDIQVDGFEYAIMNPSTKRSEIIWKKIAVKYSHCIKGKVLRSSRQDFSPNASIYKEEEMISNFGRLLIDTAWLPGSDGRMYEPIDLTLDDLPDSFIRDEKLAQQLGMKMDVVAKLAEEAGVTAEDIELLRQHPEEFDQWKAAISAQKQKPAFPERASSNPERRREKLEEQLGDAPKKEYKQRDRSVRTTRGTVDPVLWLRNQYKNKDGQMICQVCKEEMPFRKRDGEHYFETVEALSRDHFTMEHEAQFLALCPLCAAMYNEFVKQDEEAMVNMKNALINSEELEVPLRLGELDTSIRFVETHYHDIKTIIEISRQDDS